MAKIMCKQFMMNFNFGFIFLIFVVIAFKNAVDCSKYSAEANKPSGLPPLPHDTYINFKTLNKPFRMAKLNVLWSKAQLRLTDTKLKSLYTELKLHDKEEITWKKLKADGHDLDGLKEAELRSKLTGIMSSYGLLHHFDEISDPAVLKSYRFEDSPSLHQANKNLFEDQRLNHLWAKAEIAGFNAEELQALKEEFTHHQMKVDQYYNLLSDVNPKDEHHENTVAEDLDAFNTLTEDDAAKKFEEKTKRLRELHHGVKDGYDRLYRITAKGPNSQEFIEPQVQGLWKLALNANFSDEELLSLKSEMLHYENRLLKLRHLHAESVAMAQRNPDKELSKQTKEGFDPMETTIKKSSRKVEKLRLDLETRIMQKHIEL